MSNKEVLDVAEVVAEVFVISKYHHEIRILNQKKNQNQKKKTPNLTPKTIIRNSTILLEFGHDVNGHAANKNHARREPVLPQPPLFDGLDFLRLVMIQIRVNALGQREFVLTQTVPHFVVDEMHPADERIATVQVRRHRIRVQ